MTLANQKTISGMHKKNTQGSYILNKKRWLLSPDGVPNSLGYAQSGNVQMRRVISLKIINSTTG